MHVTDVKRICVLRAQTNRVHCKNCSMKDDDIEGIQIGFAPLKKVVNLPLLLTGITILIIGMVIMMWSSLTITTNVEQILQQEEPRGFIYIFPFPFVIGWDSPEIVIILPIIIAMIALPMPVILLFFRKFSRFQ